MKLNKFTELDCLSVYDVASMLVMSVSTVRLRCRQLGMKPKFNNGKYEYLLNCIDVDLIRNFKRKDVVPEIIYIHTTWHILQSRLNFIENVEDLD